MSLPPVRVPIEAKDNTGRGFRSATSSLNRFGNSAAKLAGQLGVLGGAAGFGFLVKQQLAVQDELAKTSRVLGTTSRELAGLQNAGIQLAGSTTQGVNKALEQLTRRSSEAAAGTGEARIALKDLGIDAQRFNNLGLSEKIREIAQGFEGVSNPADRARLSYQLLGREGIKLSALFTSGADAVDVLTAQTDRFGNALDSVRALEVEKANDALQTAKLAVSGLGAQLAGSLAPGLASSATGFADLVASITNTAIPAFKLLAEQSGLVDFNVRGLGKQELEARLSSTSKEIDNFKIKLIELENLRNENIGQRLANAVTDPSLFIQTGFDDAGIDSSQQAVIKALNATLERRAEVEGELQKRITARKEAEKEAAEQAAARIATAEAAATKATQDQQALLDKASKEISDAAAKRAADAEARKAEAEQAAFESRLEQLQFNSLTLEEQEIAAYENRLGILQRALDQELVTRDQYQKLVLKQAQQTQDRLQSLQTTSSKAQTNTVAGGLQNIAQVSEKAQRTLFENNKSAQISNAVVNTAAGVTQALGAYPPPISFVMAALQAAAGLKQISAIKSQGAKGGGSVPSISGGGAAAAAASSANQNAATNNQGSDFVPRAADQQITVNLVGIEDDGFYSGTQVRRLMGAFTEQIRDGAQTEFVEAVANG